MEAPETATRYSMQVSLMMQLIHSFPSRLSRTLSSLIWTVSEIINVGLAQSGAKVTLYVTETDSNGKPIAGSEGFGYKVTVSADSVIFDETNMTAEVVITNQEESTVTETPTPTPSSMVEIAVAPKIIPAATAVANHRRPEMIPRSELI